MSIYATLWTLKFPRYGEDYPGCKWIEVWGQGVPPHIGSPSDRGPFDERDTYADFLPPAVETDEEGNAPYMRAVVIVTSETRKGSPRSGQEYVDPLLVLTGEEYAKMTIDELYWRICEALRGGRPRVQALGLGPDGRGRVRFEDGSEEIVDWES